ncbi:hypothetical protein E2C01_048448 [Portunus trituberculatus]|uniref:Uncharacterized protein n=1 Tax=Portunus trituberculatus TaxID=210409 RepID=A0A5B7GAR5_PORTR|nr:hypothetical protein [Portunus trituberculatus]
MVLPHACVTGTHFVEAVGGSMHDGQEWVVGADQSLVDDTFSPADVISSQMACIMVDKYMPHATRYCLMLFDFLQQPSRWECPPDELCTTSSHP